MSKVSTNINLDSDLKKSAQNLNNINATHYLRLLCERYFQMLEIVLTYHFKKDLKMWL